MAKTKKDSYLSQREVWYKKLKRSGFEDIEMNETQLKRYSTDFNTITVVRTYEAKTEYYSMARRFLNSHQFETPRERIIWEYHSNAISCRNIAKILNKISRKKTNKDLVNIVIKRLTKEMKRLYLVGYNE